MRLLLPYLAIVASWAAAQGPDTDIPPLIKAGSENYVREPYEAARQAFLKAWEIAQQTPADNPVRYDILKRLTSVREHDDATMREFNPRATQVSSGFGKGLGRARAGV
jgi:hypothetical protein